MPADVRMKLNQAVLEGTVGAISIEDIQEVISKMITQVATETIMIPEDFPALKLLEFLIQKNSDLIAFYEELTPNGDPSNAFLSILRVGTPKRISHLIELGSEDFKEQITNLIIDHPQNNIESITKYLELLHPPFLEWKEQNVRESGPEVNTAKYLSQILDNASEETEKYIMDKVQIDDDLNREVSQYHVSIASLLEISTNDMEILFEPINYQDIGVFLTFVNEEIQSKVWQVLPEKKTEMVKDFQIRLDSDDREKRKAKKQFTTSQDLILSRLKRLIGSEDITLSGESNTNNNETNEESEDLQVTNNPINTKEDDVEPDLPPIPVDDEENNAA